MLPPALRRGDGVGGREGEGLSERWTEREKEMERLRERKKKREGDRRSRGVDMILKVCVCGGGRLKYSEMYNICVCTQSSITIIQVQKS